MSAVRPYELTLLMPAEAIIEDALLVAPASTRAEMRFQLLEAAAARLGGFDLAEFQSAFGVRSSQSPRELSALAAPLTRALQDVSMHPALALSALAREALSEAERKRTGAYHTDFRLAQRIAQLAAPGLSANSIVIDPACGAGILLTALTSAICGSDRDRAAAWLARSVCAADLSPNALRATALSLACFTDDLEALKRMRSRWYCGDSLLAEDSVWASMAPDGFDAVVGNPPWEKLKLSRHEYLKSSGESRHYGAAVNSLDYERYGAERDAIAHYSRQLLARYPSLAEGEADLYVAFTELFYRICKPSGSVAALLPGGLIRSQGTKALRRRLLGGSDRLSISVIDNRARFFEIDSRFKFLAVMLSKSRPDSRRSRAVELMHERGTSEGLQTVGRAVIPRRTLSAIRPDLSIPEVRNTAEWRLFSKIARSGEAWAHPHSAWFPEFCREVDMTKERRHFVPSAGPSRIPVVEGRMVQAHRFGAKGYLEGTGRSARWETYQVGGSTVSPQFWIPRAQVPRASQTRLEQLRAGFCDITGQTNERSLMAAIIPPGVVCGNKVPTLVFPRDTSEERLLVWTAAVNSFVFDWMIRRVLTTTVNYFLLLSVPLPRIQTDGLPWRELVRASRELRHLDASQKSRTTTEKIASLRSEIDAEIALAYGLSNRELTLILDDFPLLDRGQPALHGESRSTVTRDSVMAAFVRRSNQHDTIWSERERVARALGAVAFVPSEVALGNADDETTGEIING